MNVNTNEVTLNGIIVDDCVEIILAVDIAEAPLGTEWLAAGFLTLLSYPTEVTIQTVGGRVEVSLTVKDGKWSTERGEEARALAESLICDVTVVAA